MKELQKYLGKYSHLTPPEGSKKKIFIDVVYRECGISLQEQDVAIRREGIVLSCHPVMKSELVMYSSRVLNTLHKQHNVRLSFIR